MICPKIIIARFFLNYWNLYTTYVYWLYQKIQSQEQVAKIVYETNDEENGRSIEAGLMTWTDNRKDGKWTNDISSNL